MTLNWTCKPFEALTPAELYAIMHLRNEVFVVEQNCVYQDADQKDQVSHHLCGWDGNTLVAYCRLLPPGTGFDEMSIGRVITNPAYRRTGSGRELMQRAIVLVRELFGKGPIRIGAQLYLEKFYQSLGFRQVSDEYLEDGIPHIEMEMD